MRRYDRPSRGEPTLARCAVVSPPPLDGLFPVFVMQTLAEASWREPIKAAREPTRTDERAKSRRRERTGGEEKQPSQPAKHLSFFCFFSPYTERSSPSFSLPLYTAVSFPSLVSIPLFSYLYARARLLFPSVLTESLCKRVSLAYISHVSLAPTKQ